MHGNVCGYDDTIDWISVMHFFNKEIILVEFVFSFFKKAVSLVKHSDCITLLTTGSVTRNHIDWKKKHITAHP